MKNMTQKPAVKTEKSSDKVSKSTQGKQATSQVRNTSGGEMPDPTGLRAPKEKEVRSAFGKHK